MTALAAAGTAVPSLNDLHDFYALYAECLDETRLDDWAAYFTEGCVYKIIARENYEQGHDLCFMQADSKGMIIDRVQGITRTQMFGPRSYRRFFSGLRIVEAADGTVATRQNVLLVQTLIDQESRILLCGVAHDRLVREDGQWRFRQRIIISDSELIENSLIYPL